MAHAMANPREDKLQLDNLAGVISVPAALVGVVALVAAVLLARAYDNSQSDGMIFFYHAYLLGYMFFLSITLGSLFFVLVQHLARAGWSVSVRRIAEGISANFWLMLILSLPLYLLGAKYLYPWFDLNALHGSNEEVYKNVLRKVSYLNPTAFYVRWIVYYVIWLGLGAFMRAKSRRQDETRDPALSKQMERMSVFGIFLFGFSLTFCAFDLIMSLNPTWFSTIFGVIYFAGSMIGFYTFTILLIRGLQGTGYLKNSVTIEHYQDLGKWVFAFTFFWGYTNFAQYMLIWYANIPQETSWFKLRETGPWLGVALALLFGQLLIPFIGIISRHAKRRLQILTFWAVWQLLGHLLDLFWQIMPQGWKVLSEHGNTALANNPQRLSENRFDLYQNTHGFPFTGVGVAIILLVLVGMGGLYLASTFWSLKQAPLIPIGDPRLPEALAFENM